MIANPSIPHKEAKAMRNITEEPSNKSVLDSTFSSGGAGCEGPQEISTEKNYGPGIICDQPLLITCKELEVLGGSHGFRGEGRGSVVANRTERGEGGEAIYWQCRG